MIPFLKHATVLASFTLSILGGFSQTSFPEQSGKNNISGLVGKWRGSFITKQLVEIPFVLEIAGTSSEDTRAYFINAEERFEAGKLKLENDSLYISIDQFDNELVFKIDAGTLNGFLRRQDRKGEPTPVTALRGANYRFKSTGTKPAGDISGTYDITFKSENGNDEKAVGLFKQDGNKLRATFLRITGDSRYLDGIVEGNNFYLSSFIGGGPGLYRGSFTADGQLTGSVTGLRGGQAFAGIANENAALPDAYKLTYLKDGYTSLDFSFPNIEGKKISLKDDKYKNKVVILTITGTWCPNCIDEAGFLSAWYKENKTRGVEALALHYERQTDSSFVRKVLTRFKKRFDIQYDEVIAGTADKQVVAESLPALNTFLSFPTIIFIDKKGNVAKIYTGYNGPATGKYYDQFVKEFNQEVDRLLKDK